MRLFHFCLSVDLPPKPYYVWTFDESMGKWVNDVANWNQKWELIDGTLCLHNAAPEVKSAADDIPWLSMNIGVEEKPVKNPKAPLWSPPIPKALGLQCITMDYKITSTPGDLETSSLTMLQQQDG